MIARFEAERQALALMDHPNIARVLDAGTTDSGRPYFVMELVKGIPITQYCDEQHLSPRERLELFVPICQAVQHAHQKGIIHRDLKPSNILIAQYDDKPVPKVIDFGVAKAISQRLTEQTVFTQYGQIVGTLEYMSPEQAQFNQLDVDTRSDVYSLGVLLYELLTGETPFDKTRLRSAAFDELLRIIREEEPPKPSTRLSTAEGRASSAANRSMEPAKLSGLIRGELDWIVMKALEKDRTRRYETANGLARDIERYLIDQPVEACPPSAGYRLRKFMRRNKAALATAAIVVSALLVSTIGLAISNVLVRAERNEKTQALVEREKALGEKQLALGEKDAALTLARDNLTEAQRQQQIATEQTGLAQRRLYASQMNLAMQAWHAGEMPRVLELLEGQRPGPDDDDDFRGFEWYYLWRLCNSGRRQYLHGHTRAVLSVKFSPDGKSLASGSWDRSVRLWDVATGTQQRVLLGHSSGVWEVAYSPDGKTLASSGKETESLILWDVATGQPRHTIAGSVARLAFSPDSSLIAGGLVTESGVDAKFWDVASGAERLTIPEAGFVIGFFPDGKTIATMAGQFTNSGEVRTWDVDSGERRLTIPVRYLATAELSADGTRIATSAQQITKVWDTASGEMRLDFQTQSEARGLAFSPDGTRLATGLEDRRVIVWDIQTGETLGQDVHLDPVWSVAFSPDGKTLASSTLSGDIKLWDMTPLEETASIPIVGVSCLRFSQDGRTLLVGNPGLTKVIDVAAGKEVAVLPLGGVMAISADANSLAGPADSELGTTWDVRAGCALARFALPRPPESPPGLSLSPDGKRVATYYKHRGDNTIKLWNLDTLPARTLTGPLVSVNCAEFSPDGKLLAAGSQFQWVTVWDLATGQVKLQFAQGPAMVEVLSLAFSPDCQALAVGTHIGTVTLWEVATGRQLADFGGHTKHVNALAFSPDGRTLATAGQDKTVRLWDVVTGQERSTLTGHQGPVAQVQFSPDGSTLATAGGDGTVRLWRAATDPEALAPHVADLAQAASAVLELPPGAFQLTEAGLCEAVLRWPENADLRRRLGLLLQSEGQFAEAETCFRTVVQLKPEQVWAYFDLAVALRNQGKYVEAMAVLHDVDRLNPPRDVAQDALGWLFMAQHQYPEAENAFREATRANPNHAVAQRGLAESLKGQQRLAEALVPQGEAVHRDPTNSDSHAALGWTYFDLGQFAEAELEFRESVRLRPDDAGVHHVLGRALQGQKKFAEGLVPLREAVRLGDDGVRSTLGWVLLEQQQFTKAEEEFHEALRVNPDLSVARRGLGRTLQEQKRFAEALVPLREAVRLDPTDYYAHAALGWSLINLGQFTEAEDAFREEIRLKPETAGGHAGLGQALVEQKRFTEAEAALREALRLEPSHQWAPEWLNQALKGQGKPPETNPQEKPESQASSPGESPIQEQPE